MGSVSWTTPADKGYVNSTINVVWYVETAKKYVMCKESLSSPLYLDVTAEDPSFVVSSWKKECFETLAPYPRSTGKVILSI